MAAVAVCAFAGIPLALLVADTVRALARRTG